jgi:hypothetical protein
MENKLGSYINNLMNTIRDTEEKSFLRALTLDELKKINDDISGFIFQHIDEIETLPEFEEDTSDKAKELYMEHWTCSFCGKHTHEVDYDYLSGTDHLGCVLEQDKGDEENQLKFNFGDKNENK